MDTMFEAIDLKYLLLEHYKTLGFQEKHVMVIFMMDQLMKQENHLITAELLSLKMAMPIEEIDNVMVELLDRQLLEFSTIEGKTSTSLKPLKQMLYKRFQQQVLHQTQVVNMDEQTSIFQAIEKAFARTLSPLEISRIQDWLNFGYTPELIQTSLQDAIAKQKKSIRHMDKYLQRQTTKENFSQEGTNLAGQNPQDIQQTIHQINQKIDDGFKGKK
jgi:DnaD/phage-associated family protein